MPVTLIQRSLIIFLVSAAIIVSEVAVTRILSVIVWYHMAFLAISLVMLGIGAPGVWMALFRPTVRTLRGLLVAGGVAAPLAIFVLFRLGRSYPDQILFVALGTLLPLFLLLGAVVCAILAMSGTGEIRRLYAFDLFGAALGALLVVPLMNLIDTPSLVALCGLLPLAGLLVLPGIKTRTLSLTLILALVSLVVWHEPFRLRFTKGYDEAQISGKLLYERWTPTARITVFDSIFFVADPAIGFLWGAGDLHKWNQAEQYWIEQDGNAGTAITKFDGVATAPFDYLLQDATAIGHLLRKPQEIAVIGVGGGRDLLTGLAAGATRIDGIEINSGMISTMRDQFADFSGRIYDHPQVSIHHAEGRSFLSRTASKYSHIQISLVDTWAATAAGAFALSENNLYTIEAFTSYLSKLDDSGLLMISRWTNQETPRLAAIAYRALQELRISSPRSHMVLVVGGRIGTLLVSRKPFESQEIEWLMQRAAQGGFKVIHMAPESVPNDPTTHALANGLEGTEITDGSDLRPATDDRPFFFQFKSLLKPQVDDPVIFRLQLAVVIVASLTFLLFFLPLAGKRIRAGMSCPTPSALGYFSAIGFGFMLIELPLVQKFILYLGHPSYSTTVVLSGLLMGAGIGSFRSDRWKPRVMVLMTLVITGLLSMASQLMFDLTFSYALSTRIVLSLIFLTPVGFVLGAWLPRGLELQYVPHRPWLWAVNGTASVLASLLSIALAISFGFSVVIGIGFFCYVLASIFYFRMQREGGVQNTNC